MSTSVTVGSAESEENASTTPCFRFVTFAWVYGSQFVTNQRVHETTIMIEQLKSLRTQLDTIYKARDTDVEDNVTQIKAARKRGLGARSQLIVRLLKKSLTLKKSREGILNRMTTVELQIEALESSDFNRTMLKTLQSSADTMRKMGLEKGLSQADTAISELEDNMQLTGELDSYQKSSTRVSMVAPVSEFTPIVSAPVHASMYEEDTQEPSMEALPL
jgi:cell fate (sporulation/competence/biofilm development) regulator YmcA (YheA/YmcA/DUF963 family)